MSDQTAKLYTADTVRELDRRAIEEHGIAGYSLMVRAGRMAFDLLLERWPQPECLTVFCGGGNNGGDGYVIAALAQQRHVPVTVVQLAGAERLRGDARRAWEAALEAGVEILPWAEFNGDLSRGLVVDAMLGTGLSGEVRGVYQEAIGAINGAGLPVLAVDIPSGLCSDTGCELGRSVRAEVTATFIGAKLGLFTGRGPARVGELVFGDLNVPEAVYASATPAAEVLQLSALLSQWPARERDAHKGQFGHVLVIGGDNGYGGAVAMAAEAALRVGAGLVSVATRPEHVGALLARRPELMVKGVASGQELEPHLEAPTVLVVGPGLGRSPWSEQMLQKAIASQLPMVLDADGLNILAEGKLGRGADKSNWVLTPHPGEAARLLAQAQPGIDSRAIQADRPKACRELMSRYGATVLLKGAGTLIGDRQELDDSPLFLCPYGNPGMASGGMGDVLAGVIGGLLAQGLDLSLATRLGASLHGIAADRCVHDSGERGLLASDLFVQLRRLVNAL